MTADAKLNAPDSGAVARVGAVEVAVLQGVLTAPDAAAMADLLRRAGADPEVGSVALLALGLTAGGVPEPYHDLAAMIRDCAKPVVLGLSGHCTGGWEAVALAADVLICSVGSRFSFMDEEVGLVPGGGVTQALPRRIGVAHSLRLLIGSPMIGAAEAVALGLVDQVVEGDLPAAVVERAGRLRHRLTARHEGLRDALAGQAEIDATRQGLRGQILPAPGRIVDCVEASLVLPLDLGLAFEAAARCDLAEGEVAAGLAHARASAAVVARLLPEPAWPLPEALSVWGSGGRADLVVRRALREGLRVALCEADREALIATLEQIAAAQEAEVAEGRLTVEERDADWARLTPWLDAVADGPVLICPGAEGWVAELPGGHVALSLEAKTPDSLPKLSFISALLAEVSMASAGVMALMPVLGLQVLPVGPGGSVSRALRSALAAAIAELEAKGAARSLIAQALARRGLIGGQAAPLTQPVPADEAAILARCLGAVIVAGAELVQQGRVRCPAVLDAIAQACGIFPRWSGGPLFQADRRGLLLWRRDLALWAQEAPQIWAPPPLLDQLLAEGRHFRDLDVISG